MWGQMHRTDHSSAVRGSDACDDLAESSPLAIAAWANRARVYRRHADVIIPTVTAASRTPPWCEKAVVPTQSQPVAVSAEPSVTAGEHLLRLHADLARQRRDLQRWAAEVEDAVQPEDDAIDYVPLMDALANASRSLLVVDEIERQARAAGDAKVLAGSCAAVRDAIRVLEMRVCTLVASASRTEDPIAV
jgi:hypothetical protein